MLALMVARFPPASLPRLDLCGFREAKPASFRPGPRCGRARLSSRSGGSGLLAAVVAAAILIGSDR